ncbi:MAG TPA: TonB-dependent receptor [Bryobacteraceae bacterium]|nr:TonB-dependent receptor [Bryobacteraceae bacterium]
MPTPRAPRIRYIKRTLALSRALAMFVGFCFAAAPPSHAQTTQGLIQGTVRVAGSLTAVPGAHLRIVNQALNIDSRTDSDSNGNYTFALVPPGEYWISADAPAQLALQTVEIHGLVVPVAGALTQPIEMRPLADLFGQRDLLQMSGSDSGQLVRFYGPDVDFNRVAFLRTSGTEVGQLEPSASEVLDPRLIEKLPLPGRDVYSALVLMPLVTSDASTVRSLGLSVNGQRPTSSEFLLDGIEYENRLLTGTFPTPPETVEEYRVSTDNFSAEYGSTSGYIANAVTRRGGDTWHGLLYGNTQSQALDANSFQHNANGIARQTFVELQDGFWTGGPLPWKNWSSGTAFEVFRSRSYADPQTYFLPTQSFVGSLPATSFAAQILRKDPPLVYGTSADPTAIGGDVTLSPPIHLNRWTALERLDYTRSERQTFTGHVSAGALDRPDFNWTPYGEGGLNQSWTNSGGAVDQVWSSKVTSEFRAGFMRDSQGWSLVNANLPALSIDNGPMLPGADGPASRNVAYQSESRGASAGGGIVVAAGNHVWKTGGDVLFRTLDQSLAYESNGFYHFPDATDFGLDEPDQIEAPLSRLALESGSLRLASPVGHFHYSRFSAYAQDDYRLTPRLTINAGVRFEWFGAPKISSATPIATVGLAANSPAASVGQATIQPAGRQLYGMDSATWSGRAGLAYTPALARGKLTIRLGYGMFRDSLFDNLWATANMNDETLANFDYSGCNSGATYLALTTIVKQQCLAGFTTGSFNLTAFSTLRPALVHSFFLDTQIAMSTRWKFELYGIGSAGTGLITTDVFNRNTVTGGQPNSSLPQIYYRASDGSSVYSALSVSALYQASHAALRVFYTWSHSMDDQSDPLLGDFFDLGFSNQTDRFGNKPYYGAFTIQGQPGADWGNSDFDQRQNFVIFSYWEIPGSTRHGWLGAVSRGWKIAETFVGRAGLPYSVYAGVQNCHPICNTRADLINPLDAQINAAGPTGGRVLLNSAAFAIPPDGTNGNTGRNAFRGPGFWNLDFSAGRTFAIPTLSERTSVEFRADLFNFFNHANIEPPQPFLGALPGFILSNFGDALYGRTGNSGFPALTPFVENARQVQLLLRFHF